MIFQSRAVLGLEVSTQVLKQGTSISIFSESDMYMFEYTRDYQSVLYILQYLFSYVTDYLVKSRLHHSLVTLLSLSVTQVLVSNALSSSSRQ